MKKQHLQFIEAFIYAKTLNTLSNNILTLENNSESSPLVLKAQQLSTNLLNMCKNKINQSKLNNASFKLLLNELENATPPVSVNDNYLKIANMLKDFNYYENIVQ